MTGKIEGDDLGILPPMNLEPSSPRDVLNLDDLVPPHILELIVYLPEMEKIMLKDEAQIQEWKEQAAYPKWFLTALQTLSQGEGFEASD